MALPRPRIACFHGGGSTAKIYKVQCARLENLLKDDFEFHYFEAPFERTAGPGILPYFDEKNFAPYKTWFKSEEFPDGSGFDDAGTDGVERVLEMMRAVGEGGLWVAAMGFSQGSRVVGGLLLDQQLKAQAGFRRDIHLQFGLLCMGSAAPMISEMSRDVPHGASYGEVDRISIPTFHLHGLRDKSLEPGRKMMATYYDPKTVKLMEIDYHHAMPWNKEDIEGFVKFVRDAYESTRAKK